MKQLAIAWSNEKEDYFYMQMDDRVRITGGMYMGQTGVLATGEITTAGQVGEVGVDALGYWVVELDNGGTVMLSDDVLEVIE